PDLPITAAFSSCQEEGQQKFRKSAFPPGLLRQLPEQSLPEDLYVRFYDQQNLPTITFRPAEWPRLARAYYTWRLREVLKGYTACYKKNYLYDTQFWCLNNKNGANEHYEQLERYTLKISGGRNL